jgi:hydroxymethylbilane synthase
VLDELVPAAGQGALAIQSRIGSPAAEIAATLSDDATARCVTAERHLVGRLQATCRTPVGAHAVPDVEGVELHAWVGLPDGSQWISDMLIGPSETVGGQLADRLLAAGAVELLRQAEDHPA